MFSITYAAIALMVVCFAAAAFVFHKRPDRLGRYFGFYIVCIATWVGGNAFADLATTDLALRWWSGWCVLGGVVLVSCYLCFIDFFITERPMSWRMWLVIFVPAIIFSVLGFTPAYVIETYFIPGAPAQILPSALNYFIMAYSTTGTIYGFIRLLGFYSHATPRKRKQIVYLATGFSLLCLGGIVFTIILPFRGEYRFFTLGAMTSAITIVFGAYAILRHQLLDIRVVIQRGIIYTVLLMGSIGLYATLLFIFLALSQTAGTRAYFLSALLTSITGIFSVPFIDKKLRAWTDPIFFKNTYRFSSAAQELSQITSHYNSLSDIISHSAAALTKILRAGPVCFCLKREHTSLLSSPAIPVATLRLVDEVNAAVQPPAPYVLALPLLLEGTTIGLLLVGQKFSGEDFTDEDKELLKTFCAQAAVAIKKAVLFQEVVEYSKNLSHKVEERTREIKELQEQQAALMFDISHELQTPLTIMRGELDLLRHGDSDMPQMNALEKSVERVSTFIRALLRLAKLETGIERSTHTQVDFSALAAEVVEYVTVLAQAERITLTADIAPGITVQGDREQLEQLITNLLSNAIKYIANERRIAVSVTAQDDKVLLRVTDTGIGMSNDEVAQLGRKFLRLQRSAQSEGTGLGLALCQSIVKNHRGVLKIESAVGKGTVVMVEVPLMKVK